MKKIISLLLVVALLAFLVVTNPTSEEFADWYIDHADEVIGADASILEQVFTSFSAHLADNADRDSYMICSVFSYAGHKTLGIGMMFFPIDGLSEQADDLRDAYADWISSNK